MEEDQGDEDDTALNTMRFACETLDFDFNNHYWPYTRGGKFGDWGEWSEHFTGYFVNGANVQYEDSCGSDCDDTAMNAIKVNLQRYELAKEIKKVNMYGEWVY